MIMTEAQLRQIIKEELEAYLVEEGLMDWGKKIGKKSKMAMAGLGMAAALGASSPADVQAKEPTAATSVYTSGEIRDGIFYAPDGRQVDVSDVQAKGGTYKDYVKKYRSHTRARMIYKAHLLQAKIQHARAELAK